MRSLRSEEEIVDRVLEILGDHVTMPTKTAKAVVMSFLAADKPLPPWPVGDENKTRCEVEVRATGERCPEPAIEVINLVEGSLYLCERCAENWRLERESG